MTTMTIRSVQAADHLEWLRLRDLLWPGEPTAHVQVIANFLATPPKDSATFVLARLDGNLGGFVEVGQRHYAEGCATSPVGYLEGLYIDPDLRQQGWSRRLVATAEAWARSQGYREMASDCLLHNTESLAMHLALGYQEVERIICFHKVLASVDNASVE